MNGTVWLEQINRGLVDFIKQQLNVPVRVRKADEDFKKEDYPMCTIYNLSVGKRQEVRYFPDKVLVSRNTTTGKGLLERSAVPYSLSYQIDLWSVLQSDMDTMSRIWEFEIGRHFNLPVIDSGGVLRYANAMQSGDGIRKTDKLSGGSRVFDFAMTYNIWAEIDEENTNNREEVNLVQEIDIHYNQK